MEQVSFLSISALNSLTMSVNNFQGDEKYVHKYLYLHELKREFRV